MMLGERLGGGSAKITGTRVLPSEGQQVWVEVSIQGSGTLLGQDVTFFGTYKQTIQQGGVLQGQGHLVYMSAAGDIADWVGGGVGRVLGAGFKSSYGYYGQCAQAQGSLARLLGLAQVGEYDVDEDGSAKWEVWAWTGARVPAGATR